MPKTLSRWRPLHAQPPSPPGFVLHRVSATWLVLARSLERPLVRLGLADRETREQLFRRAPRRGRGAAPSVELTPHTSVLLRGYRHGGIAGPWFGGLLLGPRRPLLELSVTTRARAAGAPVAEALCTVVWPRLGPLWSALIGTRLESGALDGVDAIARARSAAERVRLARAAGRALRKLHEVGVDHADLHLRNLLVHDLHGSPRVVVIDLDRARFLDRPLPPSRRAGNLGRLIRSAVKHALWPEPLGRRELAAFLGAYTAEDRSLRSALRTHATRERALLALHRIGYRLAARAPSSQA